MCGSGVALVQEEEEWAVEDWAERRMAGVTGIISVASNAV